MGVLSNVGAEWRLFWVLEVIGLSFGLAVLVVKLTGSDEEVAGNEGDRCGSSGLWATQGCSIYSWVFILNLHPLAVTLLSLLVTRAVSRPELSLVVRVLRPPSRRWLFFSVSMLCGVLYQSWARWTPFTQPYYSVATVLGGITLLSAGAALVLGCGHCRKLKMAYTMGAQRFRPVDRRRRRWLFWSGFAIFFVRCIFDVVLVVVRKRQDVSDEFGRTYYYSVLVPSRYWFDMLISVLWLALDAWLVCGMGMAELHSSDLVVVDPGRALPPLLWSMLIGGCFCEGLVGLKYWIFQGVGELGDRFPYTFPAIRFVEDMTWVLWVLMVGTLLWGWTLEVRAIGYWHAASLLFDSFAYCMLFWVHAARNQILT